MAKVIKNAGKMVQAYQLGAGSSMEQQLISEGKIHRIDDSTFELFSQEVHTGTGEVAKAGDYFKVDNAGFPYPNEKAWFETNHRQIDGDTYEQLPKPLEAWEATEPMTETVQWLVDNGKLDLDESSTEKFFGATLWGSYLTAAKDAVLVFYGVTRDEDGTITGVDFNFVARSEFEATYHYYN